MAFMKHIGKHGDRKICILFRQVPGEDHMALIIYPETLPAHWQQAVQTVVESDIAQQAEELADALHRNFLPDGRPILEILHQERMIKKVRTSDIIVTPTAQSKIRLDELNKMLTEAEYKASQAQPAPAAPKFQAPQDGALSDRDIAANMVFQAKKMEIEAKQMIAEAARMKKDAQRMDPNVVAKEAPAPSAKADTSKRGRPSKTKAVADATQ